MFCIGIDSKSLKKLMMKININSKFTVLSEIKQKLIKGLPFAPILIINDLSKNISIKMLYYNNNNNNKTFLNISSHTILVSICLSKQK
jgi:hypothetical protein